MSVKIRLKRKGRKKLAIYDIIVTDSRSPRDGFFLEKIGVYNPNFNPSFININEKLALKWLFNGAQMTKTVKYLFSNLGILLKKHLYIGVKKGVISEEKLKDIFSNWKEKNM